MTTISPTAVSTLGGPAASAAATRTDIGRPAFPSGAGRIGFAHVAGRTAVVTRVAASPLKLLTPRAPGETATVITSTYGGGLVAGDRVALDVSCGPQTRCTLGTQASTKVYRAGDTRGAGGSIPPARQTLDARVDAGAVLVVAPDPVTCFAGARYEQVQRFDVADGGSLLAIDWLTSGRVACGERWVFDRYAAETVIRRAGETVARDAWVLDPVDGPIAAKHRVGRFDCFASVYAIGPVFADASAEVLVRIGAMPARPPRDDARTPVLASASLLGGDGLVLRVAGGGAEPVGRMLKDLLRVAFAAFGADPWARK